jgi:hypothetical protein
MTTATELYWQFRPTMSSNLMREYVDPPIKTGFRLIPVLLLCVLLSGCNLLPWQSTETIQEPPLIPEPTADTNATQNADASRKPLILSYADLIDFNDLSLHHPKLYEAVSTGLRLGILKPVSLEEKFDPKSPTTYEQFRKWTIAYQGAATGVDMLPVDPPQADDGSPKPKTSDSGNTMTTPSQPEVGSTNPMNPINLMILPSELQWGEHRLTETRNLTREEFCAIYTFLSHQDATARALQPAEIESANPAWKNTNRDAINMDEALSQFKDYSGIGSWARRYVAIAYRDGILQKIFGLTPARLTIEDGMNPQKEVSRGEAIVLLHTLFSKAASERQTLKPTHPKPGINPGTVEPVNPLPADGAAKTKESPLQQSAAEHPAPVSQIKAVQETSPNGTRSAIRVSGPD